ncbi:pentapeptide repeat-containing protein [Streptomyces canus]|uniref:pentapeptide repeat-containing protein n=1 Tax=Streptomyces canus TaxID=58343 RepID=UPI003864279B
MFVSVRAGWRLRTVRYSSCTWDGSRKNAKLSGANLRDAKLRGAKLDHADLTGATFEGARLGQLSF